MNSEKLVNGNNSTPNKMKLKKPLIIVLGLIIGILIARHEPPAGSGLGPASMIFMGIFACALIYLVTNVVADYIVAMFFLSAFAIFHVAPFKDVFASFASTGTWLMVGALALGAAAYKCGLLKRISFWTMRIFPETFRGQIMALLSAGLIISPLIPSVTAKATIMAPLSRSISETLGFKPHSKGASGLFSATMISSYAVGNSFLSGTLMAYTMVLLLPANFRADITWTKWFLAALPWMVVLMVLSYFAIMILHKPSEAVNIPSGYARKSLEELGPMTRDEKVVGIILVTTLILWMTQSWHNIDSALVAFVAGALLFVLGVLDRKDFREKIPWDAFVYISGILSIASLISTVKVDKWIGQMLGGVVTPLLSNMVLFIIVASVVVYIVRLAVISQVAALTIFLLILNPLAVTAGIHPWVIGFILIGAALCWNTSYQSTTYISAWSSVGGDDFITHKEALPMATAFLIISIIGLIACIPVWKMMGMIP
jgi:Di- and tricarboxylate transporters